MDYAGFFTNIQRMENDTKPAGGHAEPVELFPPSGTDKPVEPAQKAKSQEPIPTYQKQEKTQGMAPNGYYANNRAVEAGRWYVRKMKKYTKIPPGAMTPNDFSKLVEECFGICGKTYLEDIIAMLLYATVCSMQGDDSAANNILFYLQDKALNCTDKPAC